MRSPGSPQYQRKFWSQSSWQTEIIAVQALQDWLAKWHQHPTEENEDPRPGLIHSLLSVPVELSTLFPSLDGENPPHLDAPCWSRILAVLENSPQNQRDAWQKQTQALYNDLLAAWNLSGLPISRYLLPRGDKQRWALWKRSWLLSTPPQTQDLMAHWTSVESPPLWTLLSHRLCLDDLGDWKANLREHHVHCFSQWIDPVKLPHIQWYGFLFATRESAASWVDNLNDPHQMEWKNFSGTPTSLCHPTLP